MLKGLDNLKRQLDELRTAVGTLGGQFATVSIEPNGQESVEAAVRVMEAAIESNVASYRNNPMVANIKQRFRAAIYERAARARAKREHSKAYYFDVDFLDVEAKSSGDVILSPLRADPHIHLVDGGYQTNKQFAQIV